MFGKNPNRETNVKELQAAIKQQEKRDRETPIERRARREWEEKYPDLCEEIP